MLKGFNAFQLTTLFAAAPLGIEWVKMLLLLVVVYCFGC
jgi:hypothetical protein